VRPALNAGNLTIIWADYRENVGSSTSQPYGPLRPVMAMALLFYFSHSFQTKSFKI
jgi:hypothetical protein